VDPKELSPDIAGTPKPKTDTRAEVAREMNLPERKAGEILAGMEKAKNRHSSGDTLSSLGITGKQSSRWQRIARSAILNATKLRLAV
jgi:hypothetical protein